MTNPSTDTIGGTRTPGVLFICVRNGGKSQMAAGLMRQLVGDKVTVYSAGTNPGTKLNSESAASLREVGADLSGEYPKPVTASLLATVDRIVLLGGEVELDYQPTDDQIVERWVTDEPSQRGITGMDRMRLIRDDIQRRIDDLRDQIVAGSNQSDPAIAANRGVTGTPRT